MVSGPLLRRIVFPHLAAGRTALLPYVAVPVAAAAAVAAAVVVVAVERAAETAATTSSGRYCSSFAADQSWKRKACQLAAVQRPTARLAAEQKGQRKRNSCQLGLCGSFAVKPSG